MCKLIENTRMKVTQRRSVEGVAEKENFMIIGILKNKISVERIVNITRLTISKITSIGKQVAVL